MGHSPFKQIICSKKRVVLSYFLELYLNASDYANHPAISKASEKLETEARLLVPDVLSIDEGQDEWYTTFNQRDAIRREAVNISQNYKSVPLLAYFGMATMLEQPLFSVYPVTNFNLRALYHQMIHPLHSETEKEAMNILWSQTVRNKKGPYRPNHFVPIV